jgi:hypothetical protein
MRPLILIISALLLTCSLIASAKDKTLPEMIQEAQSAPAKEQPALYIKIARDQLHVADKSYSAGNPQSGLSALDNVTQYSAKAADAAVETGNKLKDTEIDIRKMADKLRDIKRNLNYDDQAPVQKAIDKMEDMRTKLLNRMFEKKKK